MARFWTLILCALSITSAEVLPRDNPSAFIHDLASVLSHNASILTNPSDPLFQQKLQRWSDLDVQTPAAIILVATERDIFETVTLAKQHKIPFVPAAGGHGNLGWSTIGHNGVMIDVTQMTAITIDTKAMTATVEPGVSTGQLVAALAEKGMFFAECGSNAVSVVAQATIGGLCQWSVITGPTSDTIVSAHIVTGLGQLLTVSATENSPVFYGLRGAGPYFGFITQVTLKIFPQSLLGADGDDAGTIWAASAVFPIDQVAEVIAAHATWINDKTARHGGLTIFNVDPASNKTVINVGLNYYGSSADARKHYDALIKLNAPSYSEERVPLVHVNDGVDPVDKKGQFKYFELAGTHSFQSNPNAWKNLADHLEKFVHDYPDAIQNTVLAIDWGESLDPPGPRPDTAWSHRDVVTWLECLIWWEDPKTTEAALSFTKEVIHDITGSFPVSQVEYYQAFDRTSPITTRFGGLDRIAKLTLLKYELDPLGLFTNVFLI